MVLFEDGTTAPETEAAPGPSFARDERVQRLEHELRVTRERLQATIAELETTNEELTTFSGEPAHRVQELARTDSDLKNLLESTRIATVLLDDELRVMNFTPAVAELFHVIEAGIGRPISRIKSHIAVLPQR